MLGNYGPSILNTGVQKKEINGAYRIFWVRLGSRVLLQDFKWHRVHVKPVGAHLDTAPATDRVRPPDGTDADEEKLEG